MPVSYFSIIAYSIDLMHRSEYLSAIIASSSLIAKNSDCVLVVFLYFQHTFYSRENTITYRLPRFQF